MASRSSSTTGRSWWATSWSAKGKIVDAYQKESKGKTMTFVVSETSWTDEATGEPVVTVRYNTICRA